MREIIIHNGVKYSRYPDSPHRQRRYFKATNKKNTSLHRVIYEEHFGPIPQGWIIHHKDGDITNNDPSNLQAMTRSEHNRIHLLDYSWFPNTKPPTPAALKAAAEWHGSEEGRKWHEKHGRDSWKNREPIKAECQHCGTEYESRVPKKYCSNKCKSAARRASGVDDVDTTCKLCGNVFKSNKYQLLRCCPQCKRNKSRHS